MFSWCLCAAAGAAGLLSALALACTQAAALLTQQQQQQRQQLKPQQEAAAAAVLDSLVSRVMTYSLLDIWCRLVHFAPKSNDLGVSAVLGSANLLPTVQPVCKLARAAAGSVMPATEGVASSGAASSSNSSRRNNNSSSSSGHVVVAEMGRWHQTMLV
jgi:hypothetical protein